MNFHALETWYHRTAHIVFPLLYFPVSMMGRDNNVLALPKIMYNKGMVFWATANYHSYKHICKGDLINGS